jgi:hypothetical protein
MRQALHVKLLRGVSSNLLVLATSCLRELTLAWPNVLRRSLMEILRVGTIADFRQEE